MSKQFSFSNYNVPVPIGGNIDAEPQQLPIKAAEMPRYDKPELNSYEMELISSKLNCTLEEAQDIEATTVTQRLSSSWKENRMKRLTASHFGEVIIRKSNHLKPSLEILCHQRTYHHLQHQCMASSMKIELN